MLNAFNKQKEIQEKIGKTKERLQNNPRLKGKSGVVVADVIAGKITSGEEKRVITPQVGKELSDQIKKQMAMNKKQNS